MPIGSIHGDLNLSNLIINQKIHIIDFDHISRAPRQVELAKRVAAARVSPKKNGGHLSFLKGYGLDEKYYSGLEHLASIQLLEDTLFLNLLLPSLVKSELNKRINYYQEDRTKAHPAWNSVW